MDDYTAAADKLFREIKHLDRIIDGDDVDLALSIAKRVRRESTLLVRALARHRDHVHSPEADNE
jgi:hypothetical protein